MKTLTLTSCSGYVSVVCNVTLGGVMRRTKTVVKVFSILSGGIDNQEHKSESQQKESKTVPLSPSPLPPHVLMTNQRN